MIKKTPKIDLTSFKYIRRLWILDSVASFGLACPLTYQNMGFWGRLKWPTLKELTNAIGLTQEKHEKSLGAHQKRYREYRIANFIISTLLYVLLALIATLIIVLAFYALGLLFVTSNINSAVFSILYVFGIAIALQIANRLSSTILDKHYADTLSFVACLYLLIEIHQNDVLILPENREIALRRIRAVRRNLILLSFRYSSNNPVPDKLAQKYFKQMENFVEEKEAQILTPTSRTRAAFEKELLPLVDILLTSSYGEFKYKRRTVKIPEIPMSRTSRILGGILRSAGIIVPLIILIGLLAYPNETKFIEPYSNIVALVSFAWLLLSIDANLNLGVVDRVIGLAKTMKELR